MTLSNDKLQQVQESRVALRATQGILITVLLLTEAPVAFFLLLAVVFEKWIGALILTGVGASIFAMFAGGSRYIGRICNLMRLVDGDLSPEEAEKLRSQLNSRGYKAILKDLSGKVGTEKGEKQYAAEILAAVNQLREGHYVPKTSYQDTLTVDVVDTNEQ